MITNYKAEGTERKRMVQTIAKEIGVDPVYQGPPTFAYQIGIYTVDRDGALVFDGELGDDETERVFDALADAGFTPQEPEDEDEGISIQMPMIDGDSLSRLEQLVAAKESLIKKALGAESLLIEEKDGKLSFPWLSADTTPDEIHAYTIFITALVNKAGKAKRVTAKDRPVDNEKYAFRCFLLSLGMIGDTYKGARKILLKNFTGSSAFKVVPKEVGDEISE